MKQYEKTCIRCGKPFLTYHILAKICSNCDKRKKSRKIDNNKVVENVTASTYTEQGVKK